MVARRFLAAATSGLVLAGLLVPSAALAAAGAPPVARDDAINTLKNVATSGNVLANDKNNGGGSLTMTGFVALSPSVGVLTIASNGAYTFTPTTNFSGTASTTYTVANSSKTRTGNILITVRATNVAPVANPDSLTVLEGSVNDVTADILANDTDADGDTLLVTAVSGATGGSVDLSFDVVTFTPGANVCGSNAAGFTYTVGDGFGTTSTTTVSITVTCVNDAPTAVGDTAAGTEDTDVIVAEATMLANDTDPEGDTLSVSGVSSPTSGSVSRAGGDVTFTPDADVCGTDSAGFDYTISDGNGGSDTGHVSIDLTCVNEVPVAHDDTISGDEDTAIQASSGDLTANDTDGDGDSLSVTDVSNATGGDAELDGGTITFTPDADACGIGIGSFDYTVDDSNGGTDTGSVSVDVDCVNDAPVAVDDTRSGAEDTDATIDAAGLAANDTDTEGDPLSVTDASSPTGGTVALVAGTITFTPDANACGTGAGGFDYTVEDGAGASDMGHVSVDLTCANDNPVAGDDDATVVEDTATDVSGSLLGNDTDADDDALDVQAVSSPTGGDVELIGTTVTFTPDPNLCGTDVAGFDYTVEDGAGGTDTAHVTIDVTCTNDGPTAADDGAAGTEDTDVVIAAATLVADGSDIDGDTLTLSGVSNATGGTVVLAAGNVTFTPTANLCGLASAGFDFTVDDGDATATAHVTIDLECVNDAPVAVADVATVLGDSAAADHDVLSNDTDVDSLTLSLVDATVDPASGTVSLNGNLVRFTPKSGFAGEALITYQVGDGDLTASGTLTVTVGGDITAPVVNAATVKFATGRVDESAPLRITWSATDASSGVASYQVQVSIAGAPFKSVYTGPKTTIVKLYPFGKSLVWRVRATDVAGNTSAWAQSAPRKIQAVQNSSTRNVYRGTWHPVGSAASSGRGYAYATTRGARATLTFTGRAVLYVSPKNSKSGYVKVFVDGKLVGRYNEQRSVAQLGRIIARASWTANGTHTIRIVNDQGGRRTNLDAFIVLR